MNSINGNNLFIISLSKSEEEKLLSINERSQAL